MAETLEQRALALLAKGERPLTVLAHQLGVGQRMMASTLKRARSAGEVERFYTTNRIKYRGSSWKAGTEMYRLTEKRRQAD